MSTLLTQGGNDARHVRRCDAKCHEAKSPACDCICEGRFHGKGLQAAQETLYTAIHLKDLLANHGIAIVAQEPLL